LYQDESGTFWDIALRLVTVGNRSFAAAGLRLWNSLHVDVQSAPSLVQHFVRNLKLIYFDNRIQTLFFNCFAIVVPEVSFT